MAEENEKPRCQRCGVMAVRDELEGERILRVEGDTIVIPYACSECGAGNGFAFEYTGPRSIQ